MINIGIVGQLGAGKTTFTKIKFLDRSQRRKYIYCTMEEDFPDYPNVFTSFSEYLKTTFDLVDIIELIDEAETAIPHSRPDFTNEKKLHTYRMGRWLVDGRKKNRFKIFNFHTLEEIPQWFYTGYLHRIIRFNTGDNLKWQLIRFEKFPDMVRSLITKPVLKQYEYGKSFAGCYDEVIMKKG